MVHSDGSPIFGVGSILGVGLARIDSDRGWPRWPLVARRRPRRDGGSSAILGTFGFSAAWTRRRLASRADSDCGVLRHRLVDQRSSWRGDHSSTIVRTFEFSVAWTETHLPSRVGSADGLLWHRPADQRLSRRGGHSSAIVRTFRLPAAGWIRTRLVGCVSSIRGGLRDRLFLSNSVPKAVFHFVSQLREFAFDESEVRLPREQVPSIQGRHRACCLVLPPSTSSGLCSPTASARVRGIVMV